MDIRSIRELFSRYYESLGYKTYPPSSILPANDPSVLFTTAGMQQFKDYYTKPEFAPHSSLVTVQPVVRTSDIAEVGDATHLTTFEMLGNFRFGEADIVKLKSTAIREAWDFITTQLQVEKKRIEVTFFGGDDTIEADLATRDIWSTYGVKTIPSGKEDNFWGPTGDQGPCGPTTEIYLDGVEVWNLVFNEYFKHPSSDKAEHFTKLPLPGLDTGSGLERLATVLSNKASVWEINPFAIWLKAVDPHYGLESRIIIDHIRAVIFLIDAGVIPGKKGQEYILRRLIRKIVFLEKKIERNLSYESLFAQIREYYAELYSLKTIEQILPVFFEERAAFHQTITRATQYLDRWIQNHVSDDLISTDVTELAFYMYESFGFPQELLFEYLVSQGLKVDRKKFDTLFVQHQEVSRQGLEKQFTGGLADNDPKTIQHHTAHHLLLAALRQVLGATVFQRGSNVTSERLRIDFSFDRKLTNEEKEKIETLVNEVISQNLPVVKSEMSRDKALSSGALAEFGQKYAEVVTVYQIGEFSKELCGGPHVTATGELGHFELLKEEASSQGVRRIKARLV